MTWNKPHREATQYSGPMPTPRAPALRIETVAKLCIPLPKNPPLRSEAYRRWVASLECAHCGKAGPSQVAHNDGAGKGMAIRSSDEFVYPLCAPTPARPGCHHVIGTSGAFKREHRRTLEAEYSARTKALAIEAGQWPKDWPA